MIKCRFALFLIVLNNYFYLLLYHPWQVSLQATALADCVEILHAERRQMFYTYETNNRDSLAKGYMQLVRLCDTYNAELSASSQISASSSQDDLAMHKGNLIQDNDKSVAYETNIQTAALLVPPADYVHSLMAKETHFSRFIFSCENALVDFDLYIEDPQNPGRKK